MECRGIDPLFPSAALARGSDVILIGRLDDGCAR